MLAPVRLLTGADGRVETFYTVRRRAGLDERQRGRSWWKTVVQSKREKEDKMLGRVFVRLGHTWEKEVCFGGVGEERRTQESVCGYRRNRADVVRGSEEG